MPPRPVDRSVTPASKNGAQSRTRTCEAGRHPIYSQASLPLEYLCADVVKVRAILRSPAPLLAEG
jgi:hypothetical protein